MNLFVLNPISTVGSIKPSVALPINVMSPRRNTADPEQMWQNAADPEQMWQNAADPEEMWQNAADPE